MVKKLEKKVNRNYVKQILKNQQESKCMILIHSSTSIWWRLILKTTFKFKHILKNNIKLPFYDLFLNSKDVLYKCLG